jgi:transposase
MRPGAGRKPRLTEQDRSRILALVKWPPPGKLERLGEGLAARDEEGAAQWSLDALEAAAKDAGIPVKRSQIRRIYRREGVRWRGIHSWAEPRGEDFAPKGPPSSPTPPNRPRGRRPAVPTNSGQ